MGVSYLVLEKGVTELVVGGTIHRIGSLRDVGKSHSGTRRIQEAAARAWKRGEMPRAVLAHGQGGSARGVEGAVYGWEQGLAHTNDHDWSGMPMLGVARIDEDGRLALYADAVATRPMGRDEAVGRGVLGGDGQLAGWRQRRIASARVLEGHRVAHANESSRGPVVDVRHKLALCFDDGTSEEQELYLTLSAEADAAAGADLVGMTVNEAWEWARTRQSRPWLEEGREVAALSGRIGFEAGGEPVFLVGGADPSYPRDVMLRSRLGGVGVAQSAEHAFQDAGDRLARYVGGTIRCMPSSGELSLSVGGSLAVSVAAGEEGEVVVSTSVPGAVAADAEVVVVPQEAAGPFLADFSQYLAECSGASLALGDERQGRLPTFGGFLSAIGVDYAIPGAGLRR